MLIKEEFEDSKGVIRSCKLKKGSKHNGQTKKVQQNDLQNIHIKLKIKLHEPH